MDKIYSKIGRIIKIIQQTLRSLHTLLTEVCNKPQFFIYLARFEYDDLCRIPRGV